MPKPSNMKKVIIPLFAMLLVFSCSKEKESPDPINNDPIDNNGGGTKDDPIAFAKVTFTDVKKLLESAKPQASHTTFDPAQNAVLNTKDGIKVTIPSNALVYVDGTPVTEDVDIEIQEFSTPADLIFNGVSTVTTDGQVLESAGMMSIAAKTKSGKPVRFDKGRSMSMDFSNPAASKPGMRPFIGKVDANGNTTWETNDDWTMQVDTASFRRILDLDSFTYCNLDKFYNSANRGHMEIKTPTFSDDETTLNFLVVKNARVSVTIPTFAKNHFKTTDNYQIPLGEEATLLVMVISDNHLFFYKKEIVTEDNAVYNLSKSDLKPTSQKDFEDQIKALSF